MSSAFRILVVFACAAVAGCRSASEPSLEESRQLDSSSTAYLQAADDMIQRGDYDPERRASLERRAIEVEETKERQEKYEQDHPWATSISSFLTDAFVDTFYNAITGKNSQESDDRTAFEGPTSTTDFR